MLCPSLNCIRVHLLLVVASDLWYILGFGYKLDNNWKVVRALVELRSCVIGNKAVCQEFTSKCQVNSALVFPSFPCDLSLRSNEREASKI